MRKLIPVVFVRQLDDVLEEIKGQNYDNKHHRSEDDLRVPLSVYVRLKASCMFFI